MNLSPLTAPSAATRCLHRTLSRIGVPFGQDPGALSAAAPHGVYAVHGQIGAAHTIRDLLDRSSQVGWRYLLLANGKPYGAIDHGMDCTNTGRVSIGDYATLFNAALYQLEAYATVGPYHLRCLDLPAMYLSFLWLHSDCEDFLCLLGSHVTDKDQLRVFHIGPNGHPDLTREIHERVATRADSIQMLPE